MALATLVSHEFSAKTQFRGAQYFRNKVVNVLNHSTNQVDARVQGRSYYFVRFVLRDGRFFAACTCPYFSEGEACKHVWATILEADKNSYIPDTDQYGRLRFGFDFASVSELKEKEPASAPNKRKANPPPAREPVWQQQLKQLTSATAPPQFVGNVWPSGRQIIYLLDPETTHTTGRLTLDIGYRERTRKGDWSKFKTKRIPLSTIPTLKDRADVQILSLLSGAKEYYHYYSYSYESLFNHCSLSPESQTVLMPLMCATGRCFLRTKEGIGTVPVEWDDDARWELSLKVRQTNSKDEYEVRAALRHDSQELDVTAVPLITEGLLITPNLRAGKLISRGAFAWASFLKQGSSLRVPATEVDALIEQLLSKANVPRLELPAEIRYEELQLSPTPHLHVRRPGNAFYSYNSNNTKLEADLQFNYEGVSIGFFEARAGVYDRSSRRFVRRDSEYENAAVELLTTLGFKQFNNEYSDQVGFGLTPKNLPSAVKRLVSEGWKIEAEGKLYRQAGSMNLSVSSGIDWFELHGMVEFGDGLVAKLPELLSALKRGETMVQLGDGSFGLLPEDWLNKYGLITSLGETIEDHLRFKRTQTGVLDALIAAQPEVKTDEAFARVLREWRNFKGIEPLSAPQNFVGTLRHYQCEALGWFSFLERFGFGGCLADDMGLGKTVQVLAMLESRRIARQTLQKAAKLKGKLSQPAEALDHGPRPSLVVVPRSLVFNWEQEATRFTPQLRMLTHTGAERTRSTAHFDKYDLILTTYGTLRRDAVDLQRAEFNYVILDESQAIKNAKTESAKAVRLLNARRRLALSGTPIENHLGELWSLFEFLNPGMLGAANVFQLSANARSLNEETRTLLARALRPFFLRRTKEQVAKELPQKLEQTIYCEMETAQRQQYNELRDHYRKSLMARVESMGLGRAKIQILEALLRLRQAACHPALLAPVQEEVPSAKLEVLLPRLSEIIAEGHKALVFSQFTSFLSIVRRRLERDGINYEYLDGKTRDRAARVNRFQTDPQCQLFLISLRAGGQGLNLTAADYVFLLDPWWNPAVEAQAIDRAHRIGQSNRVFAYRLIARDSVEEKILALQANKRELADAIINEDNSLIRNITGEELLLLLS